MPPSGDVRFFLFGRRTAFALSKVPSEDVDGSQVTFEAHGTIPECPRAGQDVRPHYGRSEPKEIATTGFGKTTAPDADLKGRS